MKGKFIISSLIISSMFIGCTKNENVEMKQRSYQEHIVVSKEEDIKAAVEEIAADYLDNVAVYYYKLNGAEEYYLNEDTYFVAASLRKVPQVMQVLDKVQSGEVSLDTELDYDEAVDYEEGTGMLQYEEYIWPMTIEELIELSLIYSDNIADNILNRLCGSTLRKYIENITEENNIPEGNKTTAKQQFKIYKRLYENPEANSNYPMVIEVLKETLFHDRLDKYIPEEIVAHKIGNYFRYYHDAGIVDRNEPYILVVLTKDIGELNYEIPDNDERNLLDWGEQAFELIAQISKDIYDIVTSK